LPSDDAKERCVWQATDETIAPTIRVFSEWLIYMNFLVSASSIRARRNYRRSAEI
jgi:hypothetical protein